MKKKQKYTFRKFLNDVHLWLGLASGIILFLVCLSGTILAFEHEIKDAFASELVVEPKGEKLSITSLTEKVTAAKPNVSVAERHNLLPIPQRERDINNKLSQNPGY